MGRLPQLGIESPELPHLSMAVGELALQRLPGPGGRGGQARGNQPFHTAQQSLDGAAVTTVTTLAHAGALAAAAGGVDLDWVRAGSDRNDYDSCAIQRPEAQESPPASPFLARALSPLSLIEMLPIKEVDYPVLHTAPLIYC